MTLRNGRNAAAATAAPDSDRIARQAADWIVLLSDDDEAARHHAQTAFLAWRKEDVRHEQAARDVEDVLRRVGALRHSSAGGARPARNAMKAVMRRRSERKVRSKAACVAVALACLVGGAGGLLLQTWPLPYLVADIRTGTGEWTTRVLEDGTQISLDARSAINVRYDKGARIVELVRGRIRVDVAREPARPFLVNTEFAHMQALGTRFIVDTYDDATLVEMLESRSIVSPSQAHSGPPAAVTLTAGQRLRITAHGLGAVETIDVPVIEGGWQQQRLVATDLPMTEVLEVLARHHRGRLDYDRDALAHVRVNAVLPLNDPDQAIRLLKASFPRLHVRSVGTWWVHVGMAP